jgi:hypothetical protein
MKSEGISQVEMARSLSLWARFPSHMSSLIHVFLTAFFGYLISSRLAISPFVFVFVSVFVVMSKLFSMMFAEDRAASKKTRIYSTIAFASLTPLLIALSPFEIVMGVLILIIYSLYPICSGKAPFDVMHHALRYIFIFILGYGSLGFFNATALLAMLAVVLFSFAGELLAGLGKRNDSGKSVASFLGIKKSMTATIFLIFVASLMASLVLNHLFEFPIQISQTSIPFYIIPALATDLYIAKPLMKARGEKRVDPFHLIRKNEVVVVVVSLLLILVMFQTGRIGTKVTVASRNFSFDVHIRTIIAGANSWDVPWIVFDYTNEDNYYYVVFHKDGVLELSQKIDGQYLRYVSSVKTQLTPFQWNIFHVVLNETTVSVGLDGEYQATAPRRLEADTSSVIISPTIPNAAGIWIMCVYSININA